MPFDRGSANRDSTDLAFTDPLTGLGNLRRFLDKTDRLIKDRADDPAPFAIAILDLDGFKPINDLLGRQAGDNILQQVAMRLAASTDNRAFVARVGADEFAILYPLIFHEEAARQQIVTLIEILSASYDVGERTARLSASVGCALFATGEETTETLVSKAETSLYHAKRSGRGQVVIYTSEMEEAAKRMTRMEQALRRAVAAGDVEPYFQPIMCLKTQRPVGFEALARWHDHDLGHVPPSTFIPLAEERGIIGPLTQLLLTKAAQEAGNWPDELFLSFNLSPSQLVDCNTGATILKIVADTGLDPRRLEIEITETGLMTDPASAGKIINDLSRAGISISLDDFGTGQSSLGRLRDYQFDKLKIDRAFISSMQCDRASEHIIKAILSMCKGLGIAAVAEGIENEDQASLLKGMGCGGGQGYLFGKPRDARATMDLLRQTYRVAAC